MTRHCRYPEFSKEYGSPMLVIHNDLDFRCPSGRATNLFSRLQRQRVPSRMVNFLVESQSVAEPKNGTFWHQEVFDCLEKYVEPGGR